MERFMWDSYPSYLQHTLTHAGELAKNRTKGNTERLEMAKKFKTQAAECFAKKDYPGAVSRYEQAYGLFKYCKREGRRIVVCDDRKAAWDTLNSRRTDAEAEASTLEKFWMEVDLHMASVLTNIAACKLEQKVTNAEEAATAASEALDVVPDYCKALYRRSQAYCLTEKYSEALADAKLCLKVAPDHAQDFAKEFLEEVKKYKWEASFTYAVIGSCKWLVLAIISCFVWLFTSSLFAVRHPIEAVVISFKRLWGAAVTSKEVFVMVVFNQIFAIIFGVLATCVGGFRYLIYLVESAEGNNSTSVA